MIRQGMFETNSSSTHSVVVKGPLQGLLSTLTPNDQGYIVTQGGEFGWGYELLTTPEEKLAYAAVHAHRKGKVDILNQVIEDQTGCSLLLMPYDGENSYDPEDFYCMGYIDHESQWLLDPFFESVDDLRALIFDPAVGIEVSNDNGGPSVVAQIYDYPRGDWVMAEDNGYTEYLI